MTISTLESCSDGAVSQPLVESELRKTGSVSVSGESPCSAVARRGDYVFDPDVPIQEARDLVIAYHYSKGTSNTRTDLHGFRRNGVLVAVAWWLPPTRVACESVSKTDWKKVVSLSRLVVRPDEPKNVCSMLIGASIRQIKKEGRWKHLVTYADHGEGHTGAIYRATNWEYIGTTGPYPKWVDPKGRQTACKATNNRTKKQMEDLGMKMVGRFHKEKFVMHLSKHNNQD